MYYFDYHINILLTRKSRLNSRFKKRACCYTFTAQNRASGVPAADWLSQTHVKNYRNFSRVMIRFFSMGEIPIKHSSLYKIKWLYFSTFINNIFISISFTGCKKYEQSKNITSTNSLLFVNYCLVT